MQLEQVRQFECKRCGNCCRTKQNIPLTLDDIFRLSDFLNMDPDVFFSEHCVEIALSNETIALPFLRNDGEQCCFLDDNICKVHFVKPYVCAFTPSKMFGDMDYLRLKMPPSCAVFESESVSHDAHAGKTYMNAMMLTTIYYSKHGTFKFKLAKPFIYRILLFKRNRDDIYKIAGQFRVARN